MKGFAFRCIILIFAACGFVSAFGQESKQCMNLSQLSLFQTSSIFERQEQMSKMKFMLISNENNIPLKWHNDSLEVSMVNYRRNSGYDNEFLTLYYRDGGYAITEYLAPASCITAIKESIQSYHHTESYDVFSNSKTSIYSYDRLTVELIEDSILYDYQMVRCYQNSDVDSIRIANNLSAKTKNKHQRALDAEVNLHLQLADSLALLERYEEAIQLLEEVYNFSPEMIPTIENHLGNYKQLQKQKSILDYSTKADELYKNEQYMDALVMYNKVLNEDMNDVSANEHREIIIKKLNVINKRVKLTFDYEEIYPEDYHFIKSSIERQLNTLMTKTNEGLLDFDFVINFDTFAINQSYYDIKRYSFGQDNKIIFNVRDSLLHLVSHPRLKPSYIEGIPVASLSYFPVKSTWNTQELTVIKKASRNIYRKENSTIPAIESALTQDSLLYKGKYNFRIKNKQINDKLYQDISVTKYRTVGGEAFIYGLIPGLGTMLATQGKEGTTYMVVSLACYVGAGVSYYYFKKFEKQLNNSSSEMSEEELNKINNKKDICKWTSIATVSIGGSFQLAGMIHALVRGIQNKKASKQLRKALREEPYPIISEEVQIK